MVEKVWVQWVSPWLAVVLLVVVEFAVAELVRQGAG